MGGKKSGKLAGILIVMAIVIFGLVYGGITLTKNWGKSKEAISEENATDKLNKICKDIVILTFSIQFIKNTLHIIIFCVSELFLLCHRQRLLSDLFFFVILEAMSIHTYNYLNNNDWWLSLHRFIGGFNGTVPPLSAE